jgi:hypothetical protein
VVGKYVFKQGGTPPVTVPTLVAIACVQYVSALGSALQQLLHLLYRIHSLSEHLQCFNIPALCVRDLISCLHSL